MGELNDPDYYITSPMTHNLTTHYEYIILKICKSPPEKSETISHPTDMNTETLLKQTTGFRDDLLKDLADIEFAMYYLEAALSDYKADGNTEALWTALYDVVAAQGGIGKVPAVSEEAAQADIERAIAEGRAEIARKRSKR